MWEAVKKTENEKTYMREEKLKIDKKILMSVSNHEELNHST